jgi:hypothetical protein
MLSWEGGELSCMLAAMLASIGGDGLFQLDLLHRLVLGKSQGVAFVLSSAQKAKLTRNSPSPRRGAWLLCSGELDPDLRREHLVSVLVVNRVGPCHARVQRSGGCSQSWVAIWRNTELASH